MEIIVHTICPYPTVDLDGKLHEGHFIKQPRICVKCEDKSCRKYLSEKVEDVKHNECNKGMSVISFALGEKNYLCNGVIAVGMNKSCPPSVKKQHKTQKIDLEKFNKWYDSMIKLVDIVYKNTETKAQEAILGLHDVKTAVSLVTRNAEVIIQNLPGATDDEKIESADKPLRSLLVSVSLLRERLDMSSIVSNPEAASHGKKRALPVYKVFHRTLRLFEESAAKLNVTLKMTGNSYALPQCYDSFSAIPLTLIDNAIKYSSSGKDVFVKIVDKSSGGVFVSVTNVGPVVPLDMREDIFKKFGRTPGAKKFTSHGSGLGLYIASIVAAAHGFKIIYECSDVNKSTGIGLNVFYFEM